MEYSGLAVPVPLMRVSVGVYEVYRIENWRDVVNYRMKGAGCKVSKSCNYGRAQSVKRFSGSINPTRAGGSPWLI
jgi:hypothetical protein